MHQLCGYKVEEKLHPGMCEQKRLNTTALDCKTCPQYKLTRKCSHMYE
jgi:hypothetical protein